MAKQPAARSPRPRKEPIEKIIDAAMQLAAEQGWRRVGLADIASTAGLSLAEVYEHGRSKPAILDAFARRVDAAVLAGVTKEDAEQAAHDRLFDVLMRRFEALAPYKEGIQSLVRDAPRDPLSTLCSGPQLLRSFAWMLVAAGVSDRGLRGLALTKGLIVVWLATLRTWLTDDDPDLARTMAALDRNLKRGERFCGLLRRPRRRTSEPPPEPTAAAA